MILFKRLIFLTLLFLSSICFASDVYYQGVSGVTSGASPIIDIPMDTGDADCTNVGWDLEYSASDVACNDTTHRDGGSGYAMLCDAPVSGPGTCISLGGAKTELWIEFFLYVNDGDSTWDATNRFLGFKSSCGATAGGLDLFVHVRDSTGYKWGFGGPGNNYGSVASDPTQNMVIRVHTTRHDTTGVFELWESITGGASWTKKADMSNVDTLGADSSWSVLVVGGNNANNLPHDWHFDSVLVYDEDPNWTF
jgi:hypothetical protein